MGTGSSITVELEPLAPPTLDDLVRVTGVSPQKLDEPCSDEHLRTISSDLTHWRTVAPHLGLEEGEIEEIERDMKTEMEKRPKVLRKWKNKYGFRATYTVITKVLLKSHMADLAEKVCRLLLADPQIPMNDSKPVNDKSAASSSTTDTTSTSSYTLEIPTTTTANEGGIQSLIGEICELEKKYDDLVDEVEDNLTKAGTDFSLVKKRILRLPVSMKHSHWMLLEPEAITAIENTTSIRRLFTLLHNHYWDFLNCELLCHIVDRFGKPQTKQSTAKYLDELRRFRTKTKLKDLIQWTGTRYTEILPVEKELVLKMGEEWKERTLEDLEQFRIEFSRRCFINSYAMQFRKGELGCIAVTFALPRSIDIVALCLQDLREFLKKHHVLRIMADRCCVLDTNIQKVIVEQSFLKKEKEQPQLPEKTTIPIISSTKDMREVEPDAYLNELPGQPMKTQGTSLSEVSSETKEYQTGSTENDQERSNNMSQEAMFGVLVDVSGSMQNAFALDSSNDASVERVHAIITTILNIVNKEVTHHNRQDKIFASAFGLNAKVDTCDLIALLDLIAGPENLRGKKGYDALVALAIENGAPHADRWIREHLSEDQAQDLYRVLCFDKTLIPTLIQKLPPESTSHNVLAWFATWVPGGRHVEGFAVHRSEAYCYAEKLIRDKDNIINRALVGIQNPQPRSVRDVSKLLDDLNLSKGSSSAASGSLHTRIRELIDPIKPYIFGGTPMCKAMRDALGVFKRSQAKSKVLFILSDGGSADGNPREISQELERLGVITVTCYLTDGHIDNPRSLLYQVSPDWSDGRVTLFEISSTMRNIETPVSYLVDAGWMLPASGESRLFVQANSLDVVDELCKTVVSQLTNPCHALVDILEKVPLAAYINHTNAGFEPKEQTGLTCYANAVAAVFHLAMHRIVGRKGGYPVFSNICDVRLIPEYGKHGASTVSVLKKVCPEYRLHFQEVNEIDARQALNHRRPLVATFFLYDEQWDKFKAFYRTSPKAILQKNDVGGGSTNPRGHAVVLMSCNPQCLVFMNSWGQGWAEGGFFRVKDAQVLNNTKFYDVYWTENDLTQSEKDAYQKEGLDNAKKLSQAFPSINNLLSDCPKCQRNSRVGDFKGDLLEARCPKCGDKFKPKNEDLVKSLYLRNM